MNLYENRIIPIYNAIEDENYQEAIELCLKPDICNIQLVIALLSYAKVSNKETKEGLDIANSLGSRNPTDLAVLETLSHTYRRCRKEDGITVLYENAFNSDPNNESFGNELFNCYTRVLDYKKMQLIAQKLYKLTMNTMYLYWSVTSMQLQQDLPQAMITVSEKMLHKTIFDTPKLQNIQPGAELLELYINILTKQGKFKYGLDQLDTLSERSTGPALIENEDFEQHVEKVKIHNLRRLTVRSNLLQTLYQSTLTNLASADPDIQSNLFSYTSQLLASEYAILDLYPDQWTAHLALITALTDLIAVIPSSPLDIHQLAFDELNKYVTYLTALQTSPTTCFLRGPYLALLQLLATLSQSRFALYNKEIDALIRLIPVEKANNESLCTLLDQHITHPWLHRIAQLVVSYIMRFQTKECCFSDLKNILFALVTGYTLTETSSLSFALSSSPSSSPNAGKDDGSSSSSTSSSGPNATEGAALHGRAVWAVPEIHPISYVWTANECQAAALALHTFLQQYYATLLNRLNERGHNYDRSTLPSVEEIAMTDLILGDGDSDEEVIIMPPSTCANTVNETSTLHCTTTDDVAATATKSKNKRKKKKKNAATAVSSPITASSSSSSKIKATVDSTSSTMSGGCGDSSRRDSYRRDVVDLLCSICKVEQTRLFLTQFLPPDNSNMTSTNHSLPKALPPSSSSSPSYLSTFHRFKGACEGGVGGEKEVQPCDELLLLATASYRLNHLLATQHYDYSDPSYCNSSQSSTKAHSRYLSLDPTDHFYTTFVHNLRCAAVCLVGVESSPYNFAPRLELLVPLRQLCMGGMALSVYNKLGVRFIQCDSMSYLITPSLLEAGLNTEALRHHRLVCNFHSGGKRDITEMMAKCFKYGNYTKALELQSFYNNCQNSSQLALSRAEAPLLELADVHHDCAGALSYLQNYDLLTESQPFRPLEQWERSLSHNQDFNILIKCDTNPLIERDNVLQYRKDIVCRIHTSQCHLFCLLNLLQGRFEAAQIYLTSLKSALSGAPEIAKEKLRFNFLPYDQHVSAGEVAFENLVDSTVLAVYELYIHIIICQQSAARSTRSPDEDGGDVIQQVPESIEITTLVQSMLQHFQDIREQLAIDSGPVSLIPTVPETPSILSPVWVRKVAYLMRTLGSVASLLMQSLHYNVIRPGDSPLPVDAAPITGSNAGTGVRRGSPGLSSSGFDASAHTGSSSTSSTTSVLDNSVSGARSQPSPQSAVVYVRMDTTAKAYPDDDKSKQACEAVVMIRGAFTDLLASLKVALDEEVNRCSDELAEQLLDLIRPTLPPLDEAHLTTSTAADSAATSSVHPSSEVEKKETTRVSVSPVLDSFASLLGHLATSQQMSLARLSEAAGKKLAALRSLLPLA